MHAPLYRASKRTPQNPQILLGLPPKCYRYYSCLKEHKNVQNPNPVGSFTKNEATISKMNLLAFCKGSIKRWLELNFFMSKMLENSIKQTFNFVAPGATLL